MGREANHMLPSSAEVINSLVKTFHLGYKNQSVYAVSGKSRCLISDKYKTSADRFI
jgi:hypothetical protein